jgi:hypothetical protein
VLEEIADLEHILSSSIMGLFALLPREEER